MKTKLPRILAVLNAFLLQVLFFSLILLFLRPYYALIHFLLDMAAVMIVLYVIAYHEEATYKLLWLLLLLLMPIFGTILFLLFGRKRSGKPIMRSMSASRRNLPNLLPQNASAPAIETANTTQTNSSETAASTQTNFSKAPADTQNPNTKIIPAPAFSNLTCSPCCHEFARKHDRLAASIANIENYTGYPLVENTNTVYYPIGEALYEKMLEELHKAENYIYCEYFIIAHGKMWNQMEEIMAAKAAQGVTVRVMYDDIGSFGTFSQKDIKRLQKRNIHCVRFNPIHFVHGTLNYRDHRKMLIIDGKSAFSGGINLADEYINEEKRFGHWKDIGFWITGEAVKNYTHMFLQFWNAYAREDQAPSEEVHSVLSAISMLPENLYPCNADLKDSTMPAKKEETLTPASAASAGGYILSYYDSPLRDKCVSNDLFIDLLFLAKDYIWFYTPYLLPGAELTDAIIKAAYRGVDVRIITPGIPDKKMIYRMTRSYYEQLITAGVRIYEYTPGFVHAKACVMDDYIATIGTVNLDYRSLYLHYENNSVFIDSSITPALKKDMEATMSVCRERHLQDVRRGFLGFFLDAILRVIAPLC